MSGQVPQYEDMEYEINGFELIASILPVPGGALPESVIVKFRNIEDIRVTIMERNNAIKSAERKYRETERSVRPDENAFAALFGIGTATASARHHAYKLSQLDCNVLITGESGTGKSFLARAIHQAQPRKGPFVTVDCSTIAPTLFESEMFGYVGGAFTGASPKGKAGFFEEADGGTIFLDEIGEIPLNIQAKLLNVIQNKVVCRVGSTKMVPGGRAHPGRHQPQSEGGCGRRALPPGPVLPAQRLFSGAAAPAQLSGGHLLYHRQPDGKDPAEIRCDQKEFVRRGLQQADRL